MKRSELKTGMIIEDSNGQKGMVLLNTANGDIVSGETWCPLDSLCKDLTQINYDGHTINAVYQPDSNMSYGYENWGRGALLWRRPILKPII